ncbi:hypothetical protein SASPL_151698 [Salvia splendens]|uniref:Disease resistance protein RPM1 n=1 Tax=Salvia splendens TaxID=180675 RepID=A0A8X8YZB8_SALSN|nr:hypothetical protein SASPL_151698 [Salvia splendens]
MAYNLQSLITVLQQILHPQQTRWIVNQNKPQLESILEKAESLLQILEKCSHAKIASLESRIRDSAHRVEDIIESRMVHQMLSTPQGVDGSLLLFSFFTPYLEQVLQQLDLEQDLELVTRDLDFATGQAVKPTELESVKLVEVEEKKMLDGAPFSSSKNYLVGVDEDLMQLKDRLLEHYEIKGSRLIRQWIAQGFVKSNGDKSLEEEAEDYLKALVDRNLLSVTRKKSNGKPLSYSIHDLLWDLCRREANEDSFRCVSFQPSYEMEDEYVSPQLMPHARSFICTWKKNISPMFSTLRLLRVLDVIRMVFEEFPREIIQLVNLRYLAFSCTSGLPIGISRLWYLQTLISAQYVPYVPSELWEMSELRHLKLITKFKIKETTFVHKKLQTLSCVWVLPSLIRSGFFETIPNIRKLGIYYEDSPKIEIDLSYLHKLEKLKCQSALNKDGSRFLHKLRFPCYIGKLTLVGCVVFRSFLTTLRALPNLGVLKIEACVFESEVEVEEEWKLADGDEFCSLRYLCLKDLNLVRWIADETNFPRLEKLIVSGCFKLEEIPSGIGEIPTLQEISLHECEDYLVASVERIMEDQLECGNDDLKVVITH